MHLSMLRPIGVHLRSSMLLFPFAVFLLSCSTVLSGYCNVHSTFWAFCESWNHIILRDIFPLKKKRVSFTQERVFLSLN